MSDEKEARLSREMWEEAIIPAWMGILAHLSREDKGDVDDKVMNALACATAIMGMAVGLVEAFGYERQPVIDDIARNVTGVMDDLKVVITHMGTLQ